MKLVISIFLFVLIGCANTKQVKEPQKVTFETLLEGSHGGYRDGEFIIINNNKDLKRIYTQINKIRKPGFPIPKIDFNKELVIALFLGEKPSGGYSIYVSSIEETKNEFHVFIKESTPEGMVATVMTQPFYFCKISRIEKKIIFK